MKAHIDDMGILWVSAENDQEKSDLLRWCEKNFRTHWPASIVIHHHIVDDGDERRAAWLEGRGR